MFNRFGRNTFRMFYGTRRNFGAGGNVTDPKPDPFYTNLGFGMQVIAYLWIFHRMKEDKGQLFGLYKPWHHEHDHSHIHYEWDDSEGNGKPKLVDHDDDEH